MINLFSTPDTYSPAFGTENNKLAGAIPDYKVFLFEQTFKVDTLAQWNQGALDGLYAGTNGTFGTNGNIGIGTVYGTTYTPYLGTLDAETKLLLHMDGTNGGTVITDSAGTHIGTVFGNLITQGTKKKFGTTAAFLDGTGDYYSLQPSPDWNFGTGDFTIDFWMYPTSSSKKGCLWYDGRETAPYHPSFVIFVNYPSALSITIGADSDGGSPYWNLISPDPSGAGTGSANKLTLNDWNHVAVVRYGTNFRTYVNGTKDVDTNSNGTLYASPEPGLIGYLFSPDPSYFQGYIDEYRISKGTARWTANFIPPATPYPIGGSTAVSGTYQGTIGTYTSKVYDGTIINNFKNITWSQLLNNGTVLGQFRTGTSSGDTTGKAWTTISSGTRPNITDNQFYQFRLILSGDGTTTPVIDYFGGTFMYSASSDTANGVSDIGAISRNLERLFNETEISEMSINVKNTNLFWNPYGTNGIYDILSPYNQKIEVWKGFIFGTKGTAEYVPAFTGYIDNIQNSDTEIAIINTRDKGKLFINNTSEKCTQTGEAGGAYWNNERIDQNVEHLLIQSINYGAANSDYFIDKTTLISSLGTKVLSLFSKPDSALAYYTASDWNNGTYYVGIAQTIYSLPETTGTYTAIGTIPSGTIVKLWYYQGTVFTWNNNGAGTLHKTSSGITNEVQGGTIFDNGPNQFFNRYGGDSGTIAYIVGFTAGGTACWVRVQTGTAGFCTNTPTAATPDKYAMASDEDNSRVWWMGRYAAGSTLVFMRFNPEDAAGTIVGTCGEGKNLFSADTIISMVYAKGSLFFANDSSGAGDAFYALSSIPASGGTYASYGWAIIGTLNGIQFTKSGTLHNEIYSLFIRADNKVFLDYWDNGGFHAYGTIGEEQSYGNLLFINKHYNNGTIYDRLIVPPGTTSSGYFKQFSLEYNLSIGTFDIGAGDKVSDVLQKLAEASNYVQYIDEGGKYHFKRRDSGTLINWNFGTNDIFSVRLVEGDGITQSPVYNKAIWGTNTGTVSYENLASQGTYGVNSYQLQNKWITQASIANDICYEITQQFSYPKKIITAEMRWLPLVKLFDIITLDYGKQGLNNTMKWQVIGITEQESPSMNTFTLKEVIV